MSFLNPALLFALPAIALPLIIHLINRRRFRKKAWGPMMFLREAMREKRGHRRLREWLVLACRMLTVAALVFAVCRPLIGGWLAGWVGSGNQPVMIVLDRSASMAMRLPGQVQSKQELGINALITESKRVSPSPLLLVDSASLQVRELKTIEELAELSGTDIRTDWPGALLAALHAWQEARYGRGELWLTSDMQETDWQPDDSRWTEIKAVYRQLSTPPTVRLLTMRGEQPNLVLTCGPGDSFNELLVTITNRNATQPTNEVPITWEIDGNRHVQSVSLTDTITSASLRIPVNATATLRSGFVSLPDDGNNRDNRAYFAVDQASELTNIVVSEDPAMARLLQLACSPWSGTNDESIQTLWRRPDDLQDIDWNKAPLVIWQGDTVLPELASLVDRGGQLLLFPDSRFDMITYSNATQAPATEPLTVATWSRHHGPLADTAGGKPMLLDQLQIRQWAPIECNGTTLATLSNQQPLIQSVSLGEGLVHTCNTLPTPSWSNLGEGLVLVPLVQRLIARGAQSLATVERLDCDANVAVAGLTMDDGTTLVYSRPFSEDQLGTLSDEVVTVLFGGIKLTTFDLAASDKSNTEGLASEWWRPFLVIMLLLLAAESVLTLPTTRPSPATAL